MTSNIIGTMDVLWSKSKAQLKKPHNLVSRLSGLECMLHKDSNLKSVLVEVKEVLVNG